MLEGSLFDRVCVQSLVFFFCSKFSLTELVLKRRNASAFIKPFLQFEGRQDEKCVGRLKMCL